MQSTGPRTTGPAASRPIAVQERATIAPAARGQSALQPAVAPATPLRSASPEDWFTDTTEPSGIRFTHRNGRDAGRFYMLESFGGGVAMIDYDLDDQVDLFFAGGGQFSGQSQQVLVSGFASALYRNQGEGHFAEVSQRATCMGPSEYSQGCAVADYNVDGFPDLLVTCYGRSRLYRNLGDGTFAQLEDEQLPAVGWGTAASFADQDRDGLPDLFLARYTDWTPETDQPCYYNNQRDLCGPVAYPGTTCLLLHNMGNDHFSDRSSAVGLDGQLVHGLAAVAADLNVDGLVDFYVASDALPNHLYLNTESGTFEEVAVRSGTAFGEWGQSEASMGVDVGDYNGDALPDIFVTNFENEDNALYRNIGNGAWIHNTVAARLFGASRMRSGFGTALVDFDSDGWLDIFVLNGNPLYAMAQSPFKQAAQLFRNREGKHFEDITAQGGPFFAESHSGRGIAIGDLNNDGSSDVVTVPMNEPVQLLQNRLPPANYVRVRLVARHGEPAGTGAVVSAPFAGRKLVRFVVQGTGYLSAFDPRIIFPLESEHPTAEITVTWPGRKTEVFRHLAAGQTHRLLEGAGEVVAQVDARE